MLDLGDAPETDVREALGSGLSRSTACMRFATPP